MRYYVQGYYHEDYTLHCITAALCRLVGPYQSADGRTGHVCYRARGPRARALVTAYNRRYVELYGGPI